MQGDPNRVLGLIRRAAAAFQAGRMDEAGSFCRLALVANKKEFHALHLLGIIELARANYAEADRLLSQAVKINPRSVEALTNRGMALDKAARPKLALASYEKALSINPNFVTALNNLGNVLWRLKRSEEALAKLDKAIALQSNHCDALCNRGNVLCDLRRYDEAVASYDRALIFNPRDALALHNRANALLQLKRSQEALASYEQAIAIAPHDLLILYDQGNALLELSRAEEALASFDKLLATQPEHTEALNRRGMALAMLGRSEEALMSYDQVLAIKPDHIEALNNRAALLATLNRYIEARDSYDRILQAYPDHPFAFGALAFCELAMCHWNKTAALARELEPHINEGKSIVGPFASLAYCADPALQLKCAQTYIEKSLPSRPALRRGASHQHEKMRIAYLSADFRRHPTAYLTAELFELHDRNAFDVIGFSFGDDDQSDIRNRIMRSFDQFHDVRSRSDHEVARLLHDLEIDIAVDLKGHTQNARCGILAYRPAPIQVSYLGFPGTTGAPFIDYVIADETVLPFDQQPFWTEKIVHLPNSYWVTDSKLRISTHTPDRRDVGLPESAFVFCCFNRSYKINPPVFDVWMRLLGSIDGSVLWLFGANDQALVNLRQEAKARAIDPDRLVFAQRLELADHLARHRLADLFLDTLPYNAHTTASDALWAGLPIVTCLGSTFAGRVCASLLRSVGLPELITHSLTDYEALATKLASDPVLLGSIRRKLEHNRNHCPLFDTDRVRRDIETAYRTMWEISKRGEAPQSFKVS
jgi:protein O-GlcNAc transferase